tara:strand:- start:7551 stop:7742 length:192 start_codon:yes stop_codon:yes gene_type:complete
MKDFKEWGPVTWAALITVVLVGVIGGEQVIAGHLSIDKWIAALSLLGSSGFIARGLWNKNAGE